MSGRNGFTLVEVLVGLTVASLALLAGMGALGFVADRSHDAEDTTLAAVSGATQRALLVEWLAGARYRAPTGEQFEGIQDERGGALMDMLLFPTTARTPLESGTTVIALYIDVDPATPERGLVAEMTGTVFDVEPRRMELVPEAAAMQLRYLPDGGGSAWESAWLSRNMLPRMIEITLEPASGDSLPLLLRYPIRVSLAGMR
jgi:prepilin-type N-terminal cleavage/methylation domain-containing protein